VTAVRSSADLDSQSLTYSKVDSTGDPVLNHLILIQAELQNLRTEIKELRSSKSPGTVPEADWLKPEDMAKLVNVPVRTLQGWHRRGRLPEGSTRQVVRGSGGRVDNLYHRETVITAVSSGFVFGVKD